MTQNNIFEERNRERRELLNDLVVAERECIRSQLLYDIILEKYIATYDFEIITGDNDE